MREKRNAHNILVGKHFGRRIYWQFRLRWDDDNKIGVNTMD